MRLSNEAVLTVFQNNLDRYYVPYGDLLSHGQYEDAEQVYFAKDEAAFSAGQWICVTVNENEVLLDVEGGTAALDEAIPFAQAKGKPLLFRLDDGTAAGLAAQRPLCKKDKSGYSHQGVFGGAKTQPASPNTDILVRHAAADDVARISALPVCEWGNLPVIIRFTKDLDSVLLAEQNGDIAGYLIYASSAPGYSDIVNVVTHPSKRGQGIGKALVGEFMTIAFANGCVPFYGEAKTAASAALARSMGFESLSPAKAVYELTERYTLRFWFEHGGGCLWSADDITRARYGYKADYHTLPLSDSLKEELHILEQRYRTYLNWDDPAAGCQWTAEEKAAFSDKATAVYAALCTQLGERYTVVNELSRSE